MRWASASLMARIGIVCGLAAAFLVASGPIAGDAALSGRDRAAPSAVSTFEQRYNPFGDAWERKSAPNPSIPVALTPGCYRREPKHTADVSNPDELAFLAKSNIPMVVEECAELVDVTDGVGSPRLRRFISDLRAASPSLKYIGYYTGSIAWTPTLVGEWPFSAGVQLGLPYADANREDWFVHKKGSPIAREHRLKNPSLGSQLDLFDMTNPELRTYLAQQLAESMILHGADGLMVDSCFDQPQVDNSIPGNVTPDEVVASWADGCVAFLAAIKQAAPTKQVYAIGYTSAAGYGRPDAEAIDFAWFQRRLQVADGFLWEDPIGPAAQLPATTQAHIERLADRIAYARSIGKQLGVFINTNVAGQSSYAQTSHEQQRTLARYYLAAYLTVMDGPATPLIHYTPMATSEQFHTAAFFEDWNLNVGQPLGPRQNPSQAVFRRDFERARVYLNGAETPLQVSLNDATFATPEGTLVTSFTIPPKSGMIFMMVSPRPPATPTLTVTPTSTPTPPPQSGCAPRPPVVIVSTPDDQGGLDVVVTAGRGALSRLEFSQTPNTRVTVADGPRDAFGSFSVDLPPNRERAVLTLRRATASGQVFAQFVVTDGCGPWPTFVGRGAG